MEDIHRRLEAGLGDRYEVVRELGSGGMATVFLATDRKHDRRVAVKVLRPEVADAVGAERFLREIDTVGRLTHPHILPLHDSGTAGDLLYFVMPYVDGESLERRLDRVGPLPVQDALRIGRECADGLAYAHQHGIVHRDVKPANILLADGHAMLADFGVARAVEGATDRETLTSTGMSPGTPGYMSPEQLSADQEADARSDVYALGSVLYEMLAGERAFRGPTAQAILARQLTEGPPSLRVVRPAVPAPVEAVVRKALQPTPADRFQTAAELGEALDAVRSTGPEEIGAPVTATTSAGREKEGGGPGGTILREGTGRRLTWGAGVLALIALSVLLVLGIDTSDAGELDPDKVVVFPMLERGPGSIPGEGQEAALMTVMAMEQTEPLKAIDGWSRLAETQRRDITLLSAEDARAIARGRSARYYVDGVVLRRTDSVAVSLRLHDVEGDSLVAQSTASGPSADAGVGRLGLQALVGLLPDLLDPGRSVDLGLLLDRNPSAVALLLQGERAYRRSRFDEAFLLYRGAVAADSLLVYAAVKGALAASWLERVHEAEHLLELAISQDTLLPRRYAHFARGLLHWRHGAADSADGYLRRTLEEEPEWPEAWTALGEVHHHLLPDSLEVGVSAPRALERAQKVDPGFTPPLIHLAEYAVLNADPERARGLLGELHESGADSSLIRHIELMIRCVEDGPLEESTWRRALSPDTLAVLNGAQILSAGGFRPDCAAGGYQAVLEAEGGAPNRKWGSLMGLAGLMVARGEYERTDALLESAISEGTVGSGAHLLYVPALVAGAPVAHRVERLDSIIRRTFGDRYEREQLHMQTLYLLGAGHAALGSRVRVELALAGLRRGPLESDPASPEEAELMARALEARLALIEGDTARALATLEKLEPRSEPTSLRWGLWESLPMERLLLARLLLARGRSESAMRVAQTFDHPFLVANLPFLAESLEIRLRAARELGMTAVADEFRSRLDELGRGDLLATSQDPHFKGG